MKNRHELIVGSAVLTIAFLSHSVVLLVFEPAMGFKQFSDFFDLDKIVPALGSTAWYVGNVMHVLVGFGALERSFSQTQYGARYARCVSGPKQKTRDYR